MKKIVPILTHESDRISILNRITNELNSYKDSEKSLVNICNILVLEFDLQAVSISCFDNNYESKLFKISEWEKEYSLNVSNNDTILLKLFFINEESLKLHLEEIQDLSVFFSIVLNLLIGAASYKKLDRLFFENKERNKELQGINRTLDVLEKTAELDESLQEICTFLPEAWQYPEHTVIRITYEKKVFTSPHFKETKWFQREHFYTPNNHKGSIEVFYTKKFPNVDDGPFLQEEKNLLLNLANLIAGSATKEIFKKLQCENTERLKELNALNLTTSITEKQTSINSTLRKICLLIPMSWQFPEYTCARIMYEGNSYTSKNFIETEWFQKESFVTLDNKKGTIHVFYTKKFPTAYDGPFLKEETQLLSNLGKLISGYINNFKGRELYNKSKKIIGKHKTEEFRKSLTKGREPLQLYFNKQVLDRYLYLDMMKYKVKNILFVATLYDAFILENEDSFFEQFMGEIYQYSLFSLPRITGVASPQEALDLLKTTHFDLVILMVGLDKDAPLLLSQEIKRKHKDLPIYLLLNHKTNIQYFEDLVPQINLIDKVFVWNGNSQILFAIVKSIEDNINVENDTQIGLVRVILLIEDSAIYYSKYLQFLYSIVFNQIQQLLSDTDKNEINKIMKMRSRPKILHARNYEDAMYIYEKYKDFLLCVISDVEFERNGTMDKKAGIQFAKHIKKESLSLPVILQSSDEQNKKRADKLEISFINKNSESFFNSINGFLIEHLGYGDFVFVDKKEKPIAVAKTLKEFNEILAVVPEESIYIHGIKNQFSIWLMSRGDIQLAKTINPLHISDYNSIEDFRQYFLELIKKYEEEKKKGKILDYDEVKEIDERHIVTLASGSLGGKGRGLLFINTFIYNLNFSKFSSEINIRTPKTAVIGTDEFDEFMIKNKLYDIVFYSNLSYVKIKELFLKANLSTQLIRKLNRLITEIKRPIAVRSSSLSEDSFSQPFAGVFDTFIVPNNNSNDRDNLKELSNAIKLVFASVFSEESRTYFKAINHKVEEESMAVVIQELVGSEHDNYYYPHISGTAQSYNYYPVAHMKPEDGFAVAAMGLGTYVVGGRKSYRFCPKYPTIDNYSTKDLLKSTQLEFFAVDLNNKEVDYLNEGEDASLALLEINAAEKHGTLNHCVSVYDFENDNITPGLGSVGPRIINFSNILKYNHIPLAELIDELLKITKDALGAPIEIEWAVDLSRTDNNLPSFYMLQIKPIVVSQQQDDIFIKDIEKSSTVLYTESSLGNGFFDDITDIIYVDIEKFDKMKTLDMTKEIEYLNNIMINEGRKYVLIGPGRWGTRDQYLGIPVSWSQISNAKIIVEISIPNFPLDSSLGSHFFHNVTSMNIGYLSIQDSSLIDYINWSIIDEQTVINKTAYFKHIRFKKAFNVSMNGKQRKALIEVNKNE